MKIIIFLLILILATLQYKLWLGDGSISQWHSLESKINKQTQNNEVLASRNQALEADILELKSGDQALEEQARFELGMVKDNEVYYQFVE